MKFSENWLREWINPKLDIRALADLLTMAGLEVDAIESLAPAFSGVVVGEILQAEPHPDADKLRICQVSNGQGEPLQIVCGAANARVGLKAPLALVDAELPDGLRIKQAKLRGVASFGMLCGADELGLEVAGEGLWELPADAPLGTDLAQWLQLNDHCIEVDLTPNRADCLSILGLAREVAALSSMPFKPAEIFPVTPTHDQRLPIRIEHGAGCPRYLGRVIRNIDIRRPTPIWMQERLRRSGIRSIDAVVDATNYVLLELGQPLHAFDLAQLDSGIVVRLAKAEEKLRLLDGREVDLAAGTLVIADQSRALAIAGVMGGEDSGVSSETRDLFIECAFFSPAQLAGQARQYGLHTEASHRYERGVDPELGLQAMERITTLLLQLVGGEPGPIVESVSNEHLPQPAKISLRRQRAELVSGMPFDDDRIEGILAGLGCQLHRQAAGEWLVTAPSWRFDLAIEEDLIEELIRITGYQQIPEQPLNATLHLHAEGETVRNLAAIHGSLRARGYNEAITYSFIDARVCRLFGFKEPWIELQNPIASDMSVMRPSLLPGLLKAAKHNQDRQESRVRFFESGLRFTRDAQAGIQQTPTLAAIACGELLTEQWGAPARKMTFHDARQDVDVLLSALNPDDYRWQAGADVPWLHPGRAASLIVREAAAGYLGELHPQLVKQLDIQGPVLVFECDLSALQTVRLPRFSVPARFPAVRRDIALVLDRHISGQQILDAIASCQVNLLKTSRIFDIYTGQGIDSNKKSVALSLTFRDSSRTLEDEEVTDQVSQIVGRLQAEFDAILRH